MERTNKHTLEAAFLYEVNKESRRGRKKSENRVLKEERERGNGPNW